MAEHLVGETCVAQSLPLPPFGGDGPSEERQTFSQADSRSKTHSISKEHSPQQLPGNRSIYFPARCSSINVKFQKSQQSPSRHKGSLLHRDNQAIIWQHSENWVPHALQFPKGQGRPPCPSHGPHCPCPIYSLSPSQAPSSPGPSPQPKLPDTLALFPEAQPLVLLPMAWSASDHVASKVPTH